MYELNGTLAGLYGIVKILKMSRNNAKKVIGP